MEKVIVRSNVFYQAVLLGQTIRVLESTSCGQNAEIINVPSVKEINDQIFPGKHAVDVPGGSY